jgi:molybdopterin/thiamine biosynthesis adenylyltransferase
VNEINPAVEAVACAVWADDESLPRLLAGANVAVDALDTMPARFMLQRAAQNLGIPMVHGAIAGYIGQVMSIFPGDAGLFALYPEGKAPERGAETGGQPRRHASRRPPVANSRGRQDITGGGQPIRNGCCSWTPNKAS